MVRSDPIGRTLRCQGAAEKGLLDIFGIQTHSDKTLRGGKDTRNTLGTLPVFCNEFSGP